LLDGQYKRVQTLQFVDSVFIVPTRQKLGRNRTQLLLGMAFRTFVIESYNFSLNSGW